MGIAKEVFAHGTQTHGNDVHGPQQIEHGKHNNGECYLLTVALVIATCRRPVILTAPNFRTQIEVSTLVETYDKTCGKPIDLNAGSLCLSITNVISSLTMSVRFEPNDPRFERYMHMVDEGFKLFGMLRPVSLFLPRRHINDERNIQEKIKSNHREIAGYFQSIVEEHRKTFDPNFTRDLVDAYLLEMKHCEDAGTADQLFQGQDPDKQIQQILGDLFSAGMETIKNTILWAMVYMLHYPDVMTKVQDEIDSVVGQDKSPVLEDYPNLPYTQATLYEVLRKSSITPLGTTHATTRYPKTRLIFSRALFSAILPHCDRFLTFCLFLLP